MLILHLNAKLVDEKAAVAVLDQIGMDFVLSKRTAGVGTDGIDVGYIYQNSGSAVYILFAKIPKAPYMQIKVVGGADLAEAVKNRFREAFPVRACKIVGEG